MSIKIKADGSIEPCDAPLKKIDSMVYALTADVDVIYVDELTPSYGIIVEKDNITIDGDGHTLEAREKWWGTGICLKGRKSVTIKNIIIRNFRFGIEVFDSSRIEILNNRVEYSEQYGIYLEHSSENTIIGNDVNHNAGYGIVLSSSTGNHVAENRLFGNGRAIALFDSSNNSIIGNEIESDIRDSVGVQLERSSSNKVAENNIMNCHNGVVLSDSSDNNEVSENRMKNSSSNIVIYYSTKNRILRNCFANKKPWVEIFESEGNVIG
ncbi:MAG: NosD domain-containing protein [Thermoproteota archaeon]